MVSNTESTSEVPSALIAGQVELLSYESIHVKVYRISHSKSIMRTSDCTELRSGVNSYEDWRTKSSIGVHQHLVWTARVRT